MRLYRVGLASFSILVKLRTEGARFGQDGRPGSYSSFNASFYAVPHVRGSGLKTSVSSPNANDTFCAAAIYNHYKWLSTCHLGKPPRLFRHQAAATGGSPYSPVPGVRIIGRQGGLLYSHIQAMKGRVECASVPVDVPPPCWPSRQVSWGPWPPSSTANSTPHSAQHGWGQRSELWVGIGVAWRGRYPSTPVGFRTMPLRSSISSETPLMALPSLVLGL